MRPYKTRRTIIGTVPHGADLLDALTTFAVNEDIKVGRITAIGATKHTVVAYYDQKSRTYTPLEYSGGMEILNLTGNISIRDGKPFVHAHLTVGDAQGKAFGGHLMKGTIVFACEIIIEEYEGEQLWRAKDETTGLFLWNSADIL